MHAKTMEGLMGASANVDLLNTPMRVYKEAETRGDTAVMERALSYAGQTAEQADKYKTVADEGTKEDAKETSEKAKDIQEKTIQARKQEQAELEQRIEQSRDTVEISETGKESLPVSAEEEHAAPDPNSAPPAAAFAEPVTYTKNGEVSPAPAEAQASVSLTV